MNYVLNFLKENWRKFFDKIKPVVENKLQDQTVTTKVIVALKWLYEKIKLIVLILYTLAKWGLVSLRDGMVYLYLKIHG
jgi:hypothetical protein